MSFKNNGICAQHCLFVVIYKLNHQRGGGGIWILRRNIISTLILNRIILKRPPDFLDKNGYDIGWDLLTSHSNHHVFNGLGEMDSYKSQAEPYFHPLSLACILYTTTILNMFKIVHATLVLDYNFPNIDLKYNTLETLHRTWYLVFDTLHTNAYTKYH